MQVEDGEVVDEDISVNEVQNDDPAVPMAKNDQTSSVSQKHRSPSASIGGQQAENVS